MMEQQMRHDTGPPTERVLKGGVVTWACNPGFPPAVIFPFSPPERFGTRNLYEFQALMYRPLYWLGRGGGIGIDFDLSIGEEPEWDSDGRTVTVRIKPWQRLPPARSRPARRTPQHTTTGSHSSPVRPDSGTVARAASRGRKRAMRVPPDSGESPGIVG